MNASFFWEGDFVGDNNRLKNTFSGVISDYDYARPGYPAELHWQICNFSGLRSGADVLEVGAGTGQATELFLDGGYNLDLLEVSDAQVRFLREKYGARGVRVFRDYFEDFSADRQYDLIYSATAFHWVDCETGYPKAWDMLNPGGTLAVFWQMSSVTRYDGGVFDGLNALKLKYMPGASLGFDADGIRAAKEKRVRQMQSGGCFGAPQQFDYRWTDVYDADRYAALLNSYSDTQLLPEDVREAYLKGVRAHIFSCGGRVELPQLACLYLAKKEA